MGSSRRWGIAVAVVVSVAITPTALAGGSVVDVDVSRTGVGSLDGSTRFVTFASPGGTTIARIAQRGGEIERSRYLRGRFTVPPVAYDGSASGLSADRTRLVLSAGTRRYPATRSEFAVLDARRLRVERIEGLRGNFSFDAISPNGRWMYLVESWAPNNPALYRVRAYDLRAHRLVPGAIVDPREPNEKMQGLPVTRSTDARGRWAYTLYERPNGEAPFIHALDTVRREARCIDLDLLAGGSAQSLRMAVSADSRTLTVVDQASAKAVVDLSTFAVAAPAATEEAATPAPEAEGSTRPLVAAGALVCLLTALGLWRAHHGRTRPAS
jgi:hypothetical protein